MKILIIEDNPALASRIKTTLRPVHPVDIARTGEEGVAQALEIDYLVIVLDLGLPDMHGLRVCEALRQKGVKTPVLVLTGIDDMQTRVQLLESGADDYVTKPFDGSELRARIGALSRRRPRPYYGRPLVIEDVTIDLTRREVRRSGVLVPLRRKEFDILEYLAVNRGRPVSREMILDHVWENSQERWNNNVDVHIKRLRDKIDRPFRGPIIKTAYGIGYMVENTPAINNTKRGVYEFSHAQPVDRCRESGYTAGQGGIGP